MTNKNYQLTQSRIEELNNLSAKQAIELIIKGEFRMYEEDILEKVILEKAHVTCDLEEMWEIFYVAMDNPTSPDNVLGRLASTRT